MNKRAINKSLQMKIKKYLEYMHEEKKTNFKDELLLGQSLSNSLKEEYYFELYGRILKNNKLFSEFSEKFLTKLTYIFEETTYGPDDLINVFIFLGFIYVYFLNRHIQKMSSCFILF